MASKPMPRRDAPASRALPGHGLSREEAAALVVVLAAHAALIAALSLAPPGKDIAPPPERMTVTIADEVADQSSSPDPMAQAAPESAPMIGETEPEPQPVPQPAPQPVVQPQPLPAPQPAPQPRPQPQARPQPQPRVVQPAPRPVPQPPPRAQPARPTAPAPTDQRPRRRPDAPSGGSQLGPDFLRGIPSGTQPGARGNPAATISDQAKAAVRVSINGKVRGPWNSCSVSGLDVEKLRARVTFQMDRSGNVIGIATPDISGKTDANAPQVARFSECAVRAIRAAAPFTLPAESYDFWKTYTLNFRKE